MSQILFTVLKCYNTTNAYTRGSNTDNYTVFHVCGGSAPARPSPRPTAAPLLSGGSKAPPLPPHSPLHHESRSETSIDQPICGHQQHSIRFKSFVTVSQYRMISWSRVTWKEVWTPENVRRRRPPHTYHHPPHPHLRPFFVTIRRWHLLVL